MRFINGSFRVARLPYLCAALHLLQGQMQQCVVWYLMSELMLICTRAKSVVALRSIHGMAVLNVGSKGSNSMLVLDSRGT